MVTTSVTFEAWSNKKRYGVIRRAGDERAVICLKQNSGHGNEPSIDGLPDCLILFGINRYRTESSLDATGLLSTGVGFATPCSSRCRQFLYSEFFFPNYIPYHIVPHLYLFPSPPHITLLSVAGAILSGYGVLILGAVIKSKIGGSAPEPEPAAPAAAPAAASGDLPSIDSPEFEKFIESADDAAIMKWVESASD